MLTFAKQKIRTYRSSASVVDGKLILSLPDATIPVVWQMEMSDVKASALEVRQDIANQNFTLVLKTQKGDETQIAPFENKENAVDALIAVTHALEQAQGQIRPLSSGSGNQPSSGASPAYHNNARAGKGLGKWAGLAAVLVALFLVISFLRSTQTNNITNAGTLPATDTASGPGTAESSGVPVSADEFLRNR